MIAQGAAVGGEAIACLTLLAVIFVSLALANRDRVRAWWREITGPLP